LQFQDFQDFPSYSHISIELNHVLSLKITDQAHMFETMENANPRSLSLILTPCDLIVKTKNLPGKARNEIKKKGTRSKRLKLTHNLGHLWS
jgi:hypothetical protein